ncbi:MAG: TRAP transporter small permease [Motiliproteus sp.]
MQEQPTSGKSASASLLTDPSVEGSHAITLDNPDYDHLEDVVFSNCLDRWVDKLGNVVALAFMVSVVISFYEIVSRYLFDAPTMWVHETVIMICALCMAYGGSYCLARDSHIRIRILYDFCGARGKRVLDIFNGVVSLFYCVLIAYAASIMAEKSLFTPLGDFRMETTGSAWDPIYPALIKGGLFLILVLMGIQCLLHLLKAIFGKSRQESGVNDV